MAPLVRITAVSYLNSVPFVYGIRRAGIFLPCELVLAPPSSCAQAMSQGLTDIALVTVAEIPRLNTPVKIILASDDDVAKDVFLIICFTLIVNVATFDVAVV